MGGRQTPPLQSEVHWDVKLGEKSSVFLTILSFFCLTSVLIYVICIFKKIFLSFVYFLYAFMSVRHLVIAPFPLLSNVF